MINGGCKKDALRYAHILNIFKRYNMEVIL